MDKIDLHSRDILGSNIEQIGELFPGVITEAKDEHGNTKKAIDFDLLRQHLSDELVEGDRERFRLDWPGKRASILKANTPTTKTLRPVREDSVDFDTTQNVFIEGDNFEVLKVLQESYLGKIKMIYIDPPYNTGKDFIYRDNFAANKGEYEEELGVRDDENGGKLVKNTETNGRYHSDWLSMMQERLIVARDLLTDDGVIFISIDDNEAAHLLRIGDEIFGDNNRVGVMKRRAARKSANLSKSMSDVCDYVVIYSKSDEVASLSVETISDSTRPVFNAGNKPALRTIPKGVSARCEDGVYEAGDYKTKSMAYSLKSRMIIKDGKLLDDVQVEGPWRVNQDIINQTVFITKNGGFRRELLQEEYERVKVMNDLLDEPRFYNENGTEETIRLFDDVKVFDTPKPVELIKHLVLAASDFGDNLDMMVLDFFSGSGTTAHAVMQLNAEDGGNRRHIQVQLAEPTDPSSEAYKAGYTTIPEISRERIRRAAKKIREDYAGQIAKRDTLLDTGFRAYTLSSSNFTDTRLHPSETTQTALLDVADTIKPDRTAEDILTEVILSLGLTLDLPVESRNIAGHTTYFVGGNSLVACFDDTVNVDIIDEIAKEKPLRVVFKDSSFANDETRINIEVRMKQLSPDTEVKVL